MTDTPSKLPSTSWPACPSTVDTGNSGMSSYFSLTGFSISSAKIPSPEPKIRPIFGDSGRFCLIKAAARSILSFKKQSPIVIKIKSFSRISVYSFGNYQRSLRRYQQMYLQAAAFALSDVFAVSENRHVLACMVGSVMNRIIAVVSCND